MKFTGIILLSIKTKLEKDKLLDFVLYFMKLYNVVNKNLYETICGPFVTESYIQIR
jgi:hypothetical protein